MILIRRLVGRGQLIKLELNQTSRPVQKSSKLSKSGQSGNRTFSFPEAGLLKIGKKKKIKKQIS